MRIDFDANDEIDVARSALLLAAAFNRVWDLKLHWEAGMPEALSPLAGQALIGFYLNPDVTAADLARRLGVTDSGMRSAVKVLRERELFGRSEEPRVVGGDVLTAAGMHAAEELVKALTKALGEAAEINPASFGPFHDD